MNDRVAKDTITTTAAGGWAHVERQLELAHDELASARHTEQFQAVGLHCREVLLSLANLVYDAERHSGALEIEPGKNDAKRKLKAYVAIELRGEAKDEERDHAAALIDLADSALNLANKTQHSRSADFRRAAMCWEATASVVNVVAITAGRSDSQPTIAELMERYLRERSPGESMRYALERLAKAPISKKLASKLQLKDVVEFAQARRDSGASGATVQADVVIFRVVLKAARDDWHLDVALEAVDRAKARLRKSGDIAPSQPRKRRPSREELARLVTYFTAQDRNSRTKVRMNEIMEFALWSARRIGEICSLRWADLDEKKRTCIVRGIRQTKYKGGRDHEFPLLGKAWDIVQRQPRVNELIFPYHKKTASARYTRAKKALGIDNLRLNDLRLEAARRLFEAGYSFEQVAQVTGHRHLDPLYRELRGDSAS